MTRDIELFLRSHPSWRVVRAALERTFTFGSYTECLSFVEAVGAEANARNHHPEITMTFDTVTVRWTTHDAHGITGRDVDMARRTDMSYAAVTPRHSASRAWEHAEGAAERSLNPTIEHIRSMDRARRVTALEHAMQLADTWDDIADDSTTSGLVSSVPHDYATLFSDLNEALVEARETDDYTRFFDARDAIMKRAFDEIGELDDSRLENPFSVDDFDWETSGGSDGTEEARGRCLDIMTRAKHGDVLLVGSTAWRVQTATGGTVFVTREGTKGRKLYRLWVVDSAECLAVVEPTNGTGDALGLPAVARGVLRYGEGMR